MGIVRGLSPVCLTNQPSGRNLAIIGGAGTHILHERAQACDIVLRQMDDPTGPLPKSPESIPETDETASDVVLPEVADEIEEEDFEQDDSEAQSGVDESSSIRSTQPRRRIFFNSSRLPPSHPEYVAWLDVMGARTAMSQSLQRSAHYIGRLHAAILMNRRIPNLQVSPFMDGAYIRTPYQISLLHFLRGVFEELAFDFTTARENRHRFLPRCGLSYGHIIQGTAIPTSVSKILGAYSNTHYCPANAPEIVRN